MEISGNGSGSNIQIQNMTEWVAETWQKKVVLHA